MPTYSISGQALAGSTINLTGAMTATTIAGPTGLYSFSNLAPGAYFVTPVRTGITFVPPNQQVTIVAANITGINFLGTSAGTAASNTTLQNIVDSVQSLADFESTLNIAGFSDEPARTIASDVMVAICATPFPHKWNETDLPVFYTTSFQQDYALINPDGSSVYNVEWLERGVAYDINNTSIPKPYCVVEAGRSLPARTGTFFNTSSMLGNPGFIVASLPNNLLYYGSWGQPNVGGPGLGNNPSVGSIYINPLSSQVTAASWSAGSGGQAQFVITYIPNALQVSTQMNIAGVFPAPYNGNWTVVSINDTNPDAPIITVTMPNNPGTYEVGGIVNNSAAASQPANPIAQIQDANGNYLVITTYGTEGTGAPLAPPGATPGTQVSGTGATTVWTVVDPIGLGCRMIEVPSQTGVVWQFNMIGQMPPVSFTGLPQTLAPLPDKYRSFFRAGFIAQCYRYSPIAKVQAKFEKEWQLWLKALNDLRVVQDRELEEYCFVPDRAIMGSGRARSTFQGAAWPYNYPRW